MTRFEDNQSSPLRVSSGSPDDLTKRLEDRWRNGTDLSPEDRALLREAATDRDSHDSMIDAYRREISDQEARLVEVEKERDDYRRAKAENDERFQLQAKAAEARVEQLAEVLNRVAGCCEDWLGHDAKFPVGRTATSRAEVIALYARAALAADKTAASVDGLPDGSQPLVDGVTPADARRIEARFLADKTAGEQPEPWMHRWAHKSTPPGPPDIPDSVRAQWGHGGAGPGEIKRTPLHDDAAFILATLTTAQADEETWAGFRAKLERAGISESYLRRYLRVHARTLAAESLADKTAGEKAAGTAAESSELDAPPPPAAEREGGYLSAWANPSPPAAEPGEDERRKRDSEWWAERMIKRWDKPDEARTGLKTDDPEADVTLQKLVADLRLLLSSLPVPEGETK